MWDSKWFKAGVATLLVFLLILIGSHISFVFIPLIVAFEVLFFSLLIAGALFYLFRPVVDWLSRKKVPRQAAIWITFFAFIALLVLAAVLVLPSLQSELKALIESSPEKFEQLLDQAERLEQIALVDQLFALEGLSMERLVERLPDLISGTIEQTFIGIGRFFDYIAGVVITLLIVPFLLYYMLNEKGRNTLPGLVERVLPGDLALKINSALSEMDVLLGTYIQGLGIVCLLIGLLAYLGFVIIGLEYALLLGLFIMITNIVPIIGPFIGAIPAIIIGLIDSPLMVLKVVIVVVLVQQADNLLIRPQVMGRKMAISPLAIIIVVLLAGRLGGLVGIILAIPIFTALKIIVNRIYEHLGMEAKKEG